MESFATDLEKLSFLIDTEWPFTAELPEDIPQFAIATPQSQQRPKYITNYIGSKQKLIDWIWNNTPDSVSSVLDAFTGSAVVAYMYKTKGLQVFANDRLRYSYHAAKAIIENGSTKLSESEIDMLAADNPKAGTFVSDNFKGIFFAKGVHGVIDSVRANCDKLSGFKKDIALFALGKTCMSGKGGFGHFSSSTDYGKRQDSPDEFKQRLKANAERISALVFDNGKENKAFREDIGDLLPKLKADLAYFDPPYATEFSTTNYEKAYHFIEGLMTYWDGLTIKSDTKVKYYESDHETVTKANATGFFQTFLGKATHIPHWLISYRDHAYPNEQQMKKIIGSLGRQSQMKTKEHKYSITSKHGEASNAKERLFVCTKGRKVDVKEETKKLDIIPKAAANFHTTIPVDLNFTDMEPMAANAMNSNGGDPKFTFILCRTGTNRNGDHFTAEELSGRHTTAVNKKVDLQHSQDFSDIVGGIVSADYLEDETGGHVECTGELYIGDTQNAQLAYKLMKRGIITQVSMECDYEEGECSICHGRFKNKADYCTHLRKFKGREFNGKPVFEVLHTVTFTGLGLLDRKGADENARILQVAADRQAENNLNEHKGESTMAENEKKDEESDVKKKEDAAAPDSDLERENRQLKAKVAELQKRIQELEAERQEAASKARAQRLIRKLEKEGVDFGSADERENELKRLAGLTDDAFAATEAAFEIGIRNAAQKKKAEPDNKKEEKKEDKKKENSEPMNQKANLNDSNFNVRTSQSNVRPHDVDDRKLSLEDRLREGFMAALQTRNEECGVPSAERGMRNAE